MKLLPYKQGTPEWERWRARPYAHNAGDAPAMMGVSPYKKRSELLRERATGIRAEPSQFVQERVLDRGLRIEVILRPLAERILGESMFPAVGSEVVASEEVQDGMELTASFDGVGVTEEASFEAKSMNEELRAALPVKGLDPAKNDASRLPKLYRVQLQQQLMVRGYGDRILFIAGDGKDDVRCCWYFNDAKLGRDILRGWRQFDIDYAELVKKLQAGEPPAPTAAPAPQPVQREALPSVSVRVEGSLKVIDNLDLFGEKLREFVGLIPKQPTTDQEFATCAADIKTLERAEDILKAQEASALASLEDVDRLRRTVRELLELASRTRLATAKLVQKRKDEIKAAEVLRGQKALADFMRQKNELLGGEFMPQVPNDFPGVIKNLRNLDSLRDAVDSHIAQCKGELQAASDLIQRNLQTYRADAAGFEFLFADLRLLVLKAPDDFGRVIQERINAHEKRQDRTSQSNVMGSPAPSPAAAPAQVVSLPARGTPRGEPTLSMKGINDAIAPLTISSEGLRDLGIEPAKVERNAKLYHVEDFPFIVAKLSQHLQACAAKFQHQQQQRGAA